MGAFSLAPLGLGWSGPTLPRACAVGFILSPLIYSNLGVIDLQWITVISFNESNPEAGNRHRIVNAFVGEMVDLAVSVLDVMDGGGGVYPQSPDPDRLRFLFDLRGGAQRQSHG